MIITFTNHATTNEQGKLWGENAKESYILLYPIAHRTLSLLKVFVKDIIEKTPQYCKTA